MTNSERWRIIEGYSSYEISDYGRVRNIKSGRIMKTCIKIKSKYPSIPLLKNGKKKMLSIHHFVLKAFVGKRPEGMQCRHLDGNPENNYYKNLKWGTHQENAIDRKNHGRVPVGDNHKSAHLRSEQVLEIRRRYVRGKGNCNAMVLGREFGVNFSTILRIVKRKLWAHLA